MSKSRDQSIHLNNITILVAIGLIVAFYGTVSALIQQ
ncbi:hypothetical protein MMIC_P1808 [Mariprofundus micogutta]|uniref:Uncharacterized protein n=1 Tax=Mariprofundus micogutta TaxID=1921010 RepID=A0A1L8CPN0_9PROT|nr:hypothetical protein MMIC_P1808 [Mariprofundus micogutta]